MIQNQNKFPKDFFWGASTSSHQVEGGLHNQWSVWELAHASESARTAEHRLHRLKGWQIPELRAEMTKPETFVSGRAVDHFNRYKEDFSLARSLNLNAFRFGIEWARIEPEEGKWDQEAIDHYKNYISELRKQGLEPFLNLWHWTNPVWFEDKGGFIHKKNITYFERFIAKVAEELLANVRYVLTINEANSLISLGYIIGRWPPGQRNILMAYRVYRNLAEAHVRSYKILKKHDARLQIGVAHQANTNIAVGRNPVAKIIARVSDYVWDEWFYNKINKYQDFVGMNFYFTNYWRGVSLKNPKQPLNDLGWYMEPSAIYGTIMRLSRKYNKPIIVTENGLADARDEHRAWWLDETVSAMERAIEQGADLRGYLHWSLLDNFEWADGWWPKFGLMQVDRANNVKRSVRNSAHHYADVISKRL